MTRSSSVKIFIHIDHSTFKYSLVLIVFIKVFIPSAQRPVVAIGHVGVGWRYPVIPAVLVALCGISLIVLGGTRIQLHSHVDEGCPACKSLWCHRIHRPTRGTFLYSSLHPRLGVSQWPSRTSADPGRNTAETCDPAAFEGLRDYET